MAKNQKEVIFIFLYVITCIYLLVRYERPSCKLLERSINCVKCISKINCKYFCHFLYAATCLLDITSFNFESYNMIHETEFSKKDKTL